MTTEEFFQGFVEPFSHALSQRDLQMRESNPGPSCWEHRASVYLSYKTKGSELEPEEQPLHRHGNADLTSKHLFKMLPPSPFSL